MSGNELDIHDGLTDTERVKKHRKAEWIGGCILSLAVLLKDSDKVNRRSYFSYWSTDLYVLSLLYEKLLIYKENGTMLKMGCDFHVCMGLEKSKINGKWHPIMHDLYLFKITGGENLNLQCTN